MSGTGLDPATRRKVREWLLSYTGSPVSPHHVAVHFRLPPSAEGEIGEIMTEVAITGQRRIRDDGCLTVPETRHDPVEVLDQLLAAVAAASHTAHLCLMSCRMCRNSVLYLLDTASYGDRDPVRVIMRRLMGLEDTHDLFHASQDAEDHGDSRVPQIRWIRP